MSEIHDKEAAKVKHEVIPSILDAKLSTPDEPTDGPSGNVIDFMPYLAARQRQLARDATFLTLFMLFFSVFFVLA